MGQRENQNHTCVYSCMTDALQYIHVLWFAVEDLTCDCLLHNKHSRHILGVDGFVSLTMIRISLQNSVF